MNIARRKEVEKLVLNHLRDKGSIYLGDVLRFGIHTVTDEFRALPDSMYVGKVFHDTAGVLLDDMNAG